MIPSLISNRSFYVAAATTLIFAVPIMIMLLLRILRGFRGKTRENFAIVGPSGTGKTQLLELLRSGEKIETYTSMEGTEATITIHNEKKQRKLQVLDCPGHPKLRPPTLERISQSDFCVFLINGESLTKDRIEETNTYAELRFRYPSLTIDARFLVSVLDQVLSHTDPYAYEMLLGYNATGEDKRKLVMNDIQTRVEASLSSHLRTKSQTKTPDSLYGGVDNEGEEMESLLEEQFTGKEFKFDRLPFPISLAVVDTKAADIDSVRKFISEKI